MGALIYSLAYAADKRKVTGIRYSSSGDYTRVVIDLSGSTSFSNNRIGNPDRLYIDLAGSVLPKEVLRKLNLDRGPLRAVRVAQFNPETVRVVFDLKEAKDYKIFTLDNPPGVVVDVYSYGGEKIVEEKRLAEEKKRAEEAAKLAEAKRLEEQKKLAEEKRLTEEKRIAEQQRLAEEKRIAEQQKLAEEKRRAEEAARLAEAKRPEEQRKPAEEKRLTKGKRLVKERRLALFPFDNLSEDRDAVRKVMLALASRLKEMGIRVVKPESVEEFLVSERVRETGHISRGLAMKAANELGVEAVLVGSIVQFSAREGGDPEVSFSARLVDASGGTILWANYVAVRGSDFAGILGLGRASTIEELIPKAVDKLLRSFSTVPPRAGGEQPYKIAVMPFENKSGVRNASLEATYMFMAELFNHPGFEVTEYGEVRQKILDLRVRYRGELDYRTLKALAEALGVDGVLVGTVELYSSGVGSSSPPKVEIAARLIDARIGGILWTDTYELSGEKNVIAFSWEKTIPVEGVAFDVVAKLVEGMEKSIWY